MVILKMRLQLKIDGIKQFKGSGDYLLSILCRIRHFVISQPFVVGAFSGSGRPEPLDSLLEDCDSEVTELLADGLSTKLSHG
ncbi:unnamed protein product [Dibothriocephalus latus]|uniref:Uncharacterized protein n=1 Tax=Dibothriocephalus latus TaxID=60516 RepID=A0A3P7LLL0_DIBLA|nr:unnamed protein product [Dibothriocephalus latus]